MTNYERLISMSGEDLGNFICELIDDCDSKCPAAKFCYEHSYGMKNGLIVWLNQEVDEQCQNTQ